MIVVDEGREEEEAGRKLRVLSSHRDCHLFAVLGLT